MARPTRQPAPESTSRRRLSALVHRLIEPHASIQAADERRRARLLSILLGAVVLLLALRLLFIGPFVETYNNLLLLWAALVVLLIAYGLSRTRFHRMAALIAVVMLTLFPYGSALIRFRDFTTPLDPFVWSVLAVLAASLLFSFQGTVVTAAVNFAGLVVFARMTGELQHGLVPYPLAFVFTTCGLIVIANMVRHYDKRHGQQQTIQMEQDQRRYQALFERTNDAVFISDLQGNLLTANQQAADLLGVDLEALTGVPFRHYVVPEEHPHAQAVTKTLLNRQTIPLYERTLLRQDGTTCPTEVNIALVYDASGKPAQIMNVVRDITQRKRIEGHLLQLRVERERVKVLHRFISDASHDFRTPITNMKTSLYLLQKLGAPADEKAQHQMAVLEDETMRLEHLLADMLTLSRLNELETAEFNFKPVEVNSLLNELIEQAQAQITGKGQQFSFEPDDTLTAIRADRSALGDALLHIIRNAVSYTPSGGSITVRTRREDSAVVVEIADTGIGISEMDLPHIFESFYRADSARSSETGGTGLGLTIARQIVELHDGRIEVDSVPDKGSTFRVFLQAAKPQRKPKLSHTPD